jgi:hypothetical protein
MGLDWAKSSRWVTWRKVARAVVSLYISPASLRDSHEFSCVSALDCLAQLVDILISLDCTTFPDKSSPNQTYTAATLKYGESIRKCTNSLIESVINSPPSGWGVQSFTLKYIQIYIDFKSQMRTPRQCLSSARHVCAWPSEYPCSARGGEHPCSALYEIVASCTYCVSCRN